MKAITHSAFGQPLPSRKSFPTAAAQAAMFRLDSSTSDRCGFVRRAVVFLFRAILVVSVISMLAIGAAADPLFTAPFLSFDTGSGPISVAIGDLNGDNKPDLAVANSGTSTVSVLLGNGNGTFGTKVDYGTGSNPQSVAVGDLNGDSKPDLAVAYCSINQVSVLLGNGNGTFGTKVDYAAGICPSSVAIGDLNRDSKPDLAIADYGSGSGSATTMSVLLGNGDGTFGAKVEYGAGIRPQSVAIGDLNGDINPDLAVANSGSNTVSVLLGNGNGTFGAKVDYGTGSTPYSVAIGDLNGDSKPDLSVANGLSNTVSVLLGNGDGTFGPKVDYGTGSGPVSVAIGDVNGDNKPDLALSNFYSHTVSVLLGSGNGTFGTTVDYGTGSGPFSVAIGDLNGDSKPDLAVANNGSNTVSLLMNTGGVPYLDAPASPRRVEFYARAYPNPARGALAIRFGLPTRSPVQLQICDVAGRVVATLVDSELRAGEHVATWDRARGSGQEAPAGVYFYELRAGDRRTVRRIVVLR